jgi:phosphoribosylanthranilate isomerase
MAVRVKICGLTNLDDTLQTIEAGADALGFNLIPSAKRFVGEDLRWLDDLPPFVCRVALIDDLARLAPSQAVHFDAVQFYADSGAGPLTLRRLPVVRLKSEESLKELAGLGDVPGVLLDSYHESALGGTGITADWNLAARAVELCPRPVILAGGLTPRNVAEAVKLVRPWGVDVSSGVEAELRRKDPEKVRAFLEAARGV